jgi:lysophospholipase L1-like esterase
LSEPHNPTDPSPRKKSRLRRWAIRLLLFFFLLFIAGELFARFYLGLGDPPLSEADPQMEYLFKPDQNCRRFGNHIKYNHYSMRSDDFPLHKSQPTELRVMVIGDSIINGGVLSDQAGTCTSLLQQKLTADLHRPVIVGNISAGSWGPPNELAYLKKFGLFDADILVIVLSSHDYADAPTFDPIVGVNSSWPEHKPHLALWEGFTRYLLPKLHHRTVSEEAYIAATAAPKQSDIDWCTKSLHEMIAMARTQGAKVLVAQHLERAETLDSLRPGHDVIFQECLRDGITPIQLAPGFEAARQRGHDPYRDMIHPDNTGNQIIATELQQAIETTLSTPTTRPATAPSR